MEKCVIILNENLPLGLLANASAVLAMTIGHKVDKIIGEDIKDASKQTHLGITNSVLPILKTNAKSLSEIYEKAKMLSEILVVDFCDLAQQSKCYTDYTRLLENTKAENLSYLGLALYGSNKKVNSLSGSLPLLR